MADNEDNLQTPLKYGSERFLVCQIPLAAFLLAIGVATQVWPSAFPWYARLLGAVIAMAGFAFIAFALFRRFIEPGRPRLVLAPDGIFQRLSHGRILHIPWDEVQGVLSVDHQIATVTGFTQTILNVPTVVVSKAFYDRLMPPRPWLRQPLNFGHVAQTRNGTVQILFRAAFFGTRGIDLRRAIEQRWRAFSRHPNAKLPPSEDERGPGHAIPPWVRRWTPAAFFILASLPVLYFILMPEDLSEATRSHYLDDHLDRTGVPARLADGSMKRLQRADIASAGIPNCPETTRSESWIPAYIAAATCIAELTLPSGERATAVFRLDTKTFTVEYKLGSFRDEKAIVPVSLSLEEADALLCRLGHCGPGASG